VVSISIQPGSPSMSASGSNPSPMRQTFQPSIHSLTMSSGGRRCDGRLGPWQAEALSGG
jgi:hypothetical protein